MDYEPYVYKTCHGLQTINSQTVLKLKEYCIEKKYEYEDMINYSPFEFTWYNVALQKFNIVPIIEIEPLFKYFHNKEQYLNAKRNLMGLNDWARQYIGIVVNSNWASDKIDYQNPSTLGRIIYRTLRKIEGVLLKVGI